MFLFLVGAERIGLKSICVSVPWRYLFLRFFARPRLPWSLAHGHRAVVFAISTFPKVARKATFVNGSLCLTHTVCHLGSLRESSSMSGAFPAMVGSASGIAGKAPERCRRLSRTSTKIDEVIQDGGRYELGIAIR